MRRGPNASALVVGVDDQHVPSTLVAEGIFEGTAVIQVHDVAESSVVHVRKSPWLWTSDGCAHARS